MNLDELYYLTQIEHVSNLYKYSLLFTIIATVLLWDKTRGSKWYIPLIPLFGLFLFSASLEYTQKGIDQSVLFHLENGGEGINIFLIAPIIKVFLIYFTPYLIWNIWIRKAKYNYFKNKNLTLYILIFSLLGSILNPAFLQITGIASLKFQKTSYQKEMHSYLETKITPNVIDKDKQRSVLYIYSESMEAGLFNNEKFPELMPQLNSLKKEGYEFTNLGQASMTGWTIAGQIASQCGIPTTSKVEHPEFFKHCSGFWLNEQGYHLEYMNGGSLEFAGKGTFWTANHYKTMDGKQVTSYVGSTQDGNIWGQYDNILFQAIEKKLDALHQQQKPFVLSALTLDTHPPQGFMSPTCKKTYTKKEYWDNYEKPSADAWHCSDQMLATLIKTVRQKYPDIYIVLSSDHLMMSRSFKKELPSDYENRYNTWVIWGPDIKPGQNNRKGTMLDIAPTFLNYLGIPAEKMGYGRNLLNTEEPTLVEKLGLSNLNIRIESTYTLGIDTPFFGTRNNQKEINSKNGNEDENHWVPPTQIKN